MRERAPTEVRLHVAGYPDSDDEERADLAWRLQEELAQIDVDDVSRPAATAPTGAKGAALEWAQLIVTVAGTVSPLLTAVLAWQRRHPGAAVTLDVDGDTLVLDEASVEERELVVRAWLERRAAR